MTFGIIKSVLAGEEMTLTIIHKRLAPHLEEILGKRAKHDLKKGDRFQMEMVQ